MFFFFFFNHSLKWLIIINKYLFRKQKVSKFSRHTFHIHKHLIIENALKVRTHFICNLIDAYENHFNFDYLFHAHTSISYHRYCHNQKGACVHLVTLLQKIYISTRQPTPVLPSMRGNLHYRKDFRLS